ncbi:uncharacterized protein LOC121971040 isoform X1 [Zingiber officinale]|uniref:Uncharacterized protein n=1 Tax=Zingiber officinale TaxID=94328 RepID=A0A8J5IEJ8_ZINOF|nr:uncharacterized protein LOC121971040 isoform X1 [Zingiber officinale]KAG6532714.1 hypothetical protein ZIOFF_006564 [Zingiber officinale]
MAPRSRRHQVSSVQPLGPLMEGLDPEAHGERSKERYWEMFRAWLRVQVDKGMSGSHFSIPSKKTDLRLVMGVLGCPLTPIPLLPADQPSRHFSIKDTPIETSSARYIVQQYLAATGCLKQSKRMKSMYVAGRVKVACHETDCGSGRIGARARGEQGCFVLWQKSPGMWSVELAVGDHKAVAGSNGEVVWRNLAWLGTNAARGPRRPLRRIVQGLDPNAAASMFSSAQCLGEKRVGEENCFVLKVSADRAAVAERSEGPCEVIRHVLYGYFSQRSGLLIYIEDSQLSRVQAPGSDATYWETTIGSLMEEYKQVDGVAVAHRGRSIASVIRFGDGPSDKARIRMEEEWRIEDVVFDVPGLSDEYFIPPKEIMAMAGGSGSK